MKIIKIIKIIGTFKLCKPFKRSKNGVVHVSNMRAKTHDDILINIDIANMKFFEKYIASAPNIINGSVTIYLFIIWRNGTFEIIINEIIKKKAMNNV